MVTPQFPPMPDELFDAHAGRVAMFHGGPVGPHAMETFVSKLASRVVKGGGELSTLGKLAAISGMPITEYSRNHSLVPALRNAHSEQEPPLYGTESGYLFRVHGILMCTVSTNLCPECVENDQLRQPFSFFRRGHNLPGIDFCAIHQSPLHKILGEYPFRLLPHQWLNSGRTLINQIQVHCAAERDFQLRLRAAYELLLRRDRPFHAHKLHVTLTNRVQELSGKVRDELRLSDYILSRVPRNWVHRYFPKKRFGEYFAPLDRTPYMRSEVAFGVFYAVCIAALFEHPHDFSKSIEEVGLLA
jgi:hypothetical protein